MKDEHLRIIQNRADPNFDVKTILDLFTIIETKEFTFIIQESKKSEFHGNCQLFVFNNKDELIDQTLYWNAVDDRSMPGKFIHKDISCRWINSRKPLEK